MYSCATMASIGKVVAGLWLILSVYSAQVLAGEKALVLVDNWSIRETHSIFFKALRGVF